MVLAPAAVGAIYLAAAVLFILGLRWLAVPRAARRGTAVAAAGAVLAMLGGVTSRSLDHGGLIAGALAVGGLLAVVAARAATGAAAAALVSLVGSLGAGATLLVCVVALSAPPGTRTRTALCIAALLSGASFSGGLLGAAKQRQLVAAQPVLPAGMRFVGLVAVVAAILGGVAMALSSQPWIAVLGISLAVLVGVLFVAPIGVNDVAVTTPALAGLTGLGVAAAGFGLDNLLMLTAGGIVAGSSMALTTAAAHATGRSVRRILAGALGAPRKPTAVKALPELEPAARMVSPEDVAIMIGYASRVIVVPGYGVAAAQAQHALAGVASMLAARGAEVSYGIHPLAGRMPGHLNVLLSAARVPYDAMATLDETNEAMSGADVALVVGACDVVNPAATTDASSPLYGMPIIDVRRARQVVFVKRSTKPGFAGVDNKLLHDPATHLLAGDAKDCLLKIRAALAEM